MQRFLLVLAPMLPVVFNFFVTSPWQLGGPCSCGIALMTSPVWDDVGDGRRPICTGSQYHLYKHIIHHHVFYSFNIIQFQYQVRSSYIALRQFRPSVCMCVHLFILQTAEDQQSLWQEVRSHTLNFKQNKQKLRNKSIKTIDLASCCRWIDFSKLMRHCVVLLVHLFFVAMGHRPRHPQEIGRTWFGKLLNTYGLFLLKTNENDLENANLVPTLVRFGSWIVHCLCSSISDCVLYVFQFVDMFRYFQHRFDILFCIVSLFSLPFYKSNSILVLGWAEGCYGMVLLVASKHQTDACRLS